MTATFQWTGSRSSWTVKNHERATEHVVSLLLRGCGLRA